MVKFMGRISYKQYMPKNPVKRGYKIWVTAEKFGYDCDFRKKNWEGWNTGEHNSGERVILDLCKELEGKGYHTYFNNYFTCISRLRS
jgi:hypothetical protein